MRRISPLLVNRRGLQSEPRSANVAPDSDPGLAAAARRPNGTEIAKQSQSSRLALDLRQIEVNRR
jgi:hypothetical protein